MNKLCAQPFLKGVRVPMTTLEAGYRTHGDVDAVSGVELETRMVATVTEVAARERINPSYGHFAVWRGW